MADDPIETGGPGQPGGPRDRQDQAPPGDVLPGEGREEDLAAAGGAPDAPPAGPAPFDDPSPEAAQSYEEQAVGAVPPESEGPPVSGDGAQDRAGGPAADGLQDEAAADPQADPLAELQAERDGYLDQLQRARADYDNLNKRRHREVAEARERGQAALVEGLLEVLDNFGFALQSAAVSEDTQLAKGVQLVHDQLREVLRRAGLEEVPGVGAPFDPSHHEALMSEADGADRAHPEVVEVLRTGYRFGSQLLRPASVKVAE